MSESFAVPPGPAARVRPATVTIANALLIVVAVIYAVSFVLALSVIGTMTEVFEEEFAGTDAEGAEGVVAGITVVVSAVYLLIAVGLVVLALLNNKGKNPARIVTWVLGGIGLCCAGFGLIGTSANTSFGGGSGDIDQERLQQRLDEAMPSWYEPVNLAILIISILALAGALLLLALPPSNEFFRKPQQPFEPPPPAYPQVG
jgi:hypothetical protein